VVAIDSADTGSSIVILSSAYPAIRGNLTPSALQAGLTSCVAADAELYNGGLTVYYSDDDLVLNHALIGDESTLQVHRWDAGTHEWQPLSSSVDTAHNSVTAPISEPGTYAAFTTNITTDVEDDGYGEVLPYRFELSQNYPNPFNPSTTIEFAVPSRAVVSVEVLNILGQRVRSLVEEEVPPGRFKVTWDGTDANGKPVATGIYVYRLQVGEHVEAKKMLLLK
jgi:hypothetical protein